MKNIDKLPNYKVRAMVLGCVRAYGVRADSPKLAIGHLRFVLNKMGLKATIVNVEPVGRAA